MSAPDPARASDSASASSSGRSSSWRKPSRRDLLALGVGAFVVAAVPFAAGRRRRVVQRKVPVMGTLADLTVVHRDEAEAQRALSAAVAELRFVDRTMTRYADDSDVGRLNLTRGTDPVVVTPETSEVLEAALVWAEASDGAFDPCLGRASQAWEVTERTTPPSSDEITPLAGGRLYRALELGERHGRPVARLHDDRARIDLGGIAKGYGVDRAVQALREAGIEHGLVNVGGDLAAFGSSADGDAWLVGVRSPAEPTAFLGTVRVRDEAVATSGDYERRFLHEGRAYHHLLDPRTAAPRATDVRSVTVVADTCLQADAAATAAFGLDRARAHEVIARVAPGADLV